VVMGKTFGYLRRNGTLKTGLDHINKLGLQSGKNILLRVKAEHIMCNSILTYTVSVLNCYSV
jgi:hypothetical protein